MRCTCPLLAQSGHRLVRRTCPLVTHQRHEARRYDTPHCEFRLGSERPVPRALTDQISEPADAAQSPPNDCSASGNTVERLSVPEELSE